MEATGQLSSLPYIRPWVCKPVTPIQPTTICRLGSEMCTGKRQLNFCLAGKVTIGLASHWPCVRLRCVSTCGLSGLWKGDEQLASTLLLSVIPLLHVV